MMFLVPGVDVNIWPESFPELGHVGAAEGVFIGLDADGTPWPPKMDSHHGMAGFVERSGR